VVARRRRARAGGGAGCDLDGLNGRAALVIGVAQCVALWPGVSRSLVTIVGGVLVGLSLGSAVEFSFLLGLVTLGAATGYDALRHGRDLLEAYSPAALTVGLCFAFVSAVLAVAWMVAYLRSHGLALFGWYRLGLAAIVALLLWRGVI
jgi:undecaprenyl-diphosphatase